MDVSLFNCLIVTTLINIINKIKHIFKSHYPFKMSITRHSFHFLPFNMMLIKELK